MSVDAIIANLPSEDPIIYLLIFVTLVYGSTGLLSEKAAEKFGIFGVAARKLQKWKADAIQRDRSLADDRLNDERRRRREVESERDYLLRENRLLKTWVQTAETRWYNVGSYLSSLGMEMPPPPLQPWVDFWHDNQSKK